MNSSNKHTIKRRSFLKKSILSGGGLILGFNFYNCEADVEIAKKAIPSLEIPEKWNELNAFLKIGNNGVVTIMSPNPEIGQNIKTSMPMIVAEELEVDWKNVLVEQASLNTDWYKRQVAGGSQSIRQGWESLRKVGATAKQMLVQTAANRWSLSLNECKAQNGIVSNIMNEETLTYAELAEEASKLEAPKEVKLKDPADFKIIGQAKKNVDIEPLLSGKPLFGIDTKKEGMVYAVISRPPGFGMKLSSLDDSEAKKVNGVIDIFKFEDSQSDLRGIMNEKVAVIANSTWSAMKARKALKLSWVKSDAVENTSDHDAGLNKLLQERQKEPRRNDGDIDKAFAEADIVLEKIYEAPFLPHNCLEPMNFYADITGDKAEVLGPVQTPQWARIRLAKLLDRPETDITVGMTRMGGGFGRRLFGDFVIEAAQLSQKVNKPVQLIFSREDDMVSGTYRPASKYRIKAGVKNGEVTAYHLTEACVNGNMYDNITNFFPAGAIPNMRIDTNSLESNISTGAWRAPYTNFLAFAEQSFFDELAKEMGKDEIDLRLELFEKAKSNADAGYEYDPEKSIAVTKLALEKAKWGKARAGISQGFCMYYSHNTHVAEIADVAIEDGQAVVKKITCAIHCGIVVNPLGAINQVEGGIIDGIGHAMYGDLSFEDGKPSANNFHQYRLIRMGEQPEIEVHFVPSKEDPTGLGEPSLPPAGGAIANAIFKATGKRLYKQPFVKEDALLG